MTEQPSSPKRRRAVASARPPAAAVESGAQASANAPLVPSRIDPTQTSTEQIFRGVLDFSPDAVVIVDSDGQIQLVNHQTEVLFGYSRDELIGHGIERLIPARFHAAHRRHRHDYTKEPHTRPMGAALELFGCRKDGGEFPVEISLSPLLVEGEALVIGTIRDVSERKALEAALRASERRAHEETTRRLTLLQTILDQIPVGVYLVRGQAARLVLANRAIATIWGGTWPEGQPLEAFLAEVGTRIFAMSGQPIGGDDLATLRALRTRVPALHQQEVLRRRDGTTLPVLVSAIPLNPAGDSRDIPLIGTTSDTASPASATARSAESFAVVVHQDVTALREAERLKDEFVAIAAHELRNPMGTLAVYGSMLRRGSLRAQPGSAELAEWQVEALEGIEQVTRQLVSLTDDLLDVTKLQAGGFWMHPEPHDLAALLRRVVSRIQRTTEQHHLLLSGADEPIVAHIDVRRMEQVVTNLLSNAIKYSPNGGAVTISLSRQREESRPVVDLDVRDAGIGIAPEDQPRIFSRFARGANARARQIDGTGLGLYLCHELIERQGGHIWFESVLNLGTTFHVRLPVYED